MPALEKRYDQDDSSGSSDEDFVNAASRSATPRPSSATGTARPSSRISRASDGSRFSRRPKVHSSSSSESTDSEEEAELRDELANVDVEAGTVRGAPVEGRVERVMRSITKGSASTGAQRYAAVDPVTRKSSSKSHRSGSEHKRKSSRRAQANSLGDDIQRMKRSKAPAPAVDPALSQPVKRKSRWWIYVLVALVLLIIAGVVIFFVVRNSKSDESDSGTHAMNNSSMAAEHQNATLTASSASGNATLGLLSVASVVTAATASATIGSAPAVSFDNGQYHAAGAATAASQGSAAGTSASGMGVPTGLQTASTTGPATASSDGYMSIQTQNAGNEPAQSADHGQSTKPAQTVNQADTLEPVRASDARAGQHPDQSAEPTSLQNGDQPSITVHGGQGGFASGYAQPMSSSGTSAPDFAQGAQAAPSRQAQPLPLQGQQLPTTNVQQGDARPTNGWSVGQAPSPDPQHPQAGTPTWSQNGSQAQDGKPSAQQPQEGPPAQQPQNGPPTWPQNGSPAWSQIGYGQSEQGEHQDQPALRPTPIPVGVGPVEHGEAANATDVAEHGESGARVPSWNADKPQADAAASHPFANSTAFQAQQPASFQNMTGNGTWFESSQHYGPCGFATDNSDFVVALSNQTWHNSRDTKTANSPSKLCGAEVLVTNAENGISVKAWVAEHCGTCEGDNALDLSKAAFEALTETSGGLDRGVLPILWGFTGNVSSVEPHKNGSSVADHDDASGSSKASPSGSSSGGNWFTGWFDDN